MSMHHSMALRVFCVAVLWQAEAPSIVLQVRP